jgi:hypothetical protein
MLMMKLFIIFVLLSLVSCSSVSSDKTLVSENQNVTPSPNKIAEVKLCDLFNSPESFEQKSIKVKAIYRYGFEWSEFYSLKCPSETGIWVKAPRNKCQNSGKVDEMDHAGMGGRTVGVVVIGKLSAKGNYGHMGGFKYLFEVDCFERAEMIDRQSPVPSSLTPEQRRKVEEFENQN